MRISTIALLLAVSFAASAQTLPSVIRISAPKYPPADQAAGHNGTATIKATISVDGTVANAAVYKSSGYKSLDDAALKALSTGSFTPAKDSEGNPVKAEIVVPLTFDSGVESPEQQRAYLKKHLAMPCKVYDDSLVRIAASESREPSESANFRWPLSLFEQLMQSEKKIGSRESLIPGSNRFYSKFKRKCEKNPDMPTYQAFSDAVGSRP